MTDPVELHRTRTCGHCGAVLNRANPNWRKNKFCGKTCYREAEHAKGPARFWSKVDKGPHPKGCWLYTGFTKWDGYGWLHRKVNGKNRYLTAHRYAWILAHGAPANGEHILHECDIPACCNPAHLRLGTHQENMADQVAKGRQVRGERARHKLTLAKVRIIRAEYRRTSNGRSNKYELAARFDVHHTSIMNVIKGRYWKSDQPSKILHPDRVRPRRAA